MTYQRLPYEDAATSTQMSSDCRAVEAALRPAPSLRYEDQPREVPKPSISVSAAAARLGAAYTPD